MKYTSGAAFRQAIDARLKRVVADHDEATMIYTRRQIVFDRLLARLLFKHSDQWALKGGVALTYRLNLPSRFTRDLDLLLRASPELVDKAIQEAIATDLDDFFSFTVQRRQKLIHFEDASSIRYHVLAVLDGRRFDTFVIDIGFDLPGSLPPDRIPGSELLTFAELDRLIIPTIPIEVHLAEKLHAYVRGYGEDRLSTRVKDMVDMVLIGREQQLLAGRTLQALGHTFSMRGSVPPGSLAAPPEFWRGTYRDLAVVVGIDPDLDAGYVYAASLFDPLLAGGLLLQARWSHHECAWV